MPTPAPRWKTAQPAARSVVAPPNGMNLLVVDDDSAVRHACCEIGKSAGFQIFAAGTIAESEAILNEQTIDIVLLDLRVPGGSSLDLLERARSAHPELVVILMTAFATVASAVEAMRNGASDYLTKPFALEELMQVLDRARRRRTFELEARRLREGTGESRSLSSLLIGNTPAMQQLSRMITKVAQSSHPVLILGETGTGKELVARAVHEGGALADRPFLAVDCGALVQSLIESELFGYVKGAFTGADKAKDGLLVAAGDGTVFLDEIGDLPLDMQTRLLRALQEKEVRPIGASEPVAVHARILAATNRDLASMVEQGSFRKDLYFRLNVVNLRVPPLRQRRDDIPLLAAHFLERMRREDGVDYVVSDEALRVMHEYDWPGNVRELEHAIERACAISSGPVLTMAELPTQLQEFRAQTARGGSVIAAAPPAEHVTVANHQSPGIVSIAELEKQAILNTIQQLNGDKLMAARLLGIGKTTLYRKLKEYGIEHI
ncbi:sigma-54-dependent transcriptional regulator [Terriglobus albidus]|uniref:sigma-54-dependent transcriptional regulator n=1 Tax=Terriglobus albidus TaxID=1592106 RepID=UPI0021DFA64D|nr:sigma-54 dependent transcriptional regulator [Terriglobus albidus]